jgi:hypothetical protein
MHWRAVWAARIAQKKGGTLNGWPPSLFGGPGRGAGGLDNPLMVLCQQLLFFVSTTERKVVDRRFFRIVYKKFDNHEKIFILVSVLVAPDLEF